MQQNHFYNYNEMQNDMNNIIEIQTDCYENALQKLSKNSFKRIMTPISLATFLQICCRDTDYKRLIANDYNCSG